MTRSREDVQRVAEARREQARGLRAQGLTWREVGERMGCAYQRAQQLAKPVAKRRGNPNPGGASSPRSRGVEWRGSINDYLTSRLLEIEASVRAVVGVET